MFECIFFTVQTYTVVKFQLGGLFMDYKKKIRKYFKKSIQVAGILIFKRRVA